MKLNWSPKASRSSPVLIEMRRLSSPRPMLFCAARSASMGAIMRRASAKTRQESRSATLDKQRARAFDRGIDRSVGLR